jgi:hypothetical protein
MIRLAAPKAAFSFAIAPAPKQAVRSKALLAAASVAMPGSERDHLQCPVRVNVGSAQRDDLHGA